MDYICVLELKKKNGHLHCSISKEVTHFLIFINALLFHLLFFSSSKYKKEGDRELQKT